MMIAKLLPPAALAVLARTEKSWEALARVVLYRYLDLTVVNVLEKWLAVDRSEFFEHVHTLSCPTGPNRSENINAFLNSHLKRFPKLSYLALHRGPVPSTLSQSLAKNTLKVLKLQGCFISFDMLVTLLNYFCKLKHLSLCYVTEKQSEAPSPRSRYHPEKLTLVGSRSPIHRELLNLSLVYKQLAFNLFLDNNTMGQDFTHFIDQSKGSLEYLEFGCNVIGVYHVSPMICPTDRNPRFSFTSQSTNIP